MEPLNIHYKSDSCEQSFTRTVIVGIEIHLSQTFLINVLVLWGPWFQQELQRQH